jgi:hypothetical protein
LKQAKKRPKGPFAKLESQAQAKTFSKDSTAAGGAVTRRYGGWMLFCVLSDSGFRVIGFGLWLSVRALFVSGGCPWAYIHSFTVSPFSAAKLEIYGGKNKKARSFLRIQYNRRIG